MGNWRTVKIEGTCDWSDVSALRAAMKEQPNMKGYHCLTYSPSIYGLPDWASTSISAQGNLAESGYSVEDVADQLKKLAQIAPSLELAVHCGGENESLLVVSTIVVSKGEVTIKDPRIDTLNKTSDSQMMSSFMKCLSR